MARYDFSNSPHVCTKPKAATTGINTPIYIAESPWFIVLSTCAYLCIGCAIILVAWPITIRFLLLICLGTDYLRILILYGLRNHSCAVMSLIQDCNKWQYRLFSGKGFKAKLIKQKSYCSNLILIFYLRHINGGRYLIIPCDSISKRNYRKLALAYHNTR